MQGIYHIWKFIDPCKNSNCSGNTDTCVKGKCQCGKQVPAPVCNLNSEYPLCLDGHCFCTKTNGTYLRGDGSSRGSCASLTDKCHDNGECGECAMDDDCSRATPMADTCASNKCQCGTGPTCLSTLSDQCVGGMCMCGSNPQCTGADTCLNQICMCK